MKTYLDCIPCFMQQALRVGRLSTDNEEEIKKILDNVGERIKDIPMESSPPEISMYVYDQIKEVTGNDDPFAEVKIDHIKKAQKLYPHMEEILEETDDPLLDAVKLSIAGNIIDLGVDKTFNIEEDILNWDQGMRRLALGAFMAGEPSGVDELYEHAAFDYMPREVAEGDIEAASQFSAAARSLIRDARRCRDRTRPLADWCALMAEWLDAYITIEWATQIATRCPPRTKTSTNCYAPENCSSTSPSSTWAAVRSPTALHSNSSPSNSPASRSSAEAT